MDLIKPDGGGIGPLIHDPGGGLSQIAPPFSSEILLFESTVAGTSHVEGIEALSPQIVPGARLRFSREPDKTLTPAPSPWISSPGRRTRRRAGPLSPPAAGSAMSRKTRTRPCPL